MATDFIPPEFKIEPTLAKSDHTLRKLRLRVYSDDDIVSETVHDEFGPIQLNLRQHFVKGKVIRFTLEVIEWEKEDEKPPKVTLLDTSHALIERVRQFE